MKQNSLGTADYGLIGHPLEHSFSKVMFNRLFASDGSGCQYENFNLPTLDAAALYSLVLLNPRLKGFNVTSPYKEKIMEFLDRTDTLAQAVGAVNTVKIERRDDGFVTALKGYNTDVFGFTEAIGPLLADTDRKALILGTGGASKAAVTALAMLGIEALKVSRTGRDGAMTYADLTPQVMEEYSVIVNCTPAGMYPAVEAMPPVPMQHIDSRHLCFDMIYNPEETLFLREARSRGARTANGSEMLMFQAMKALDIWQNE